MQSKQDGEQYEKNVAHDENPTEQITQDGNAAYNDTATATTYNDTHH